MKGDLIEMYKIRGIDRRDSHDHFPRMEMPKL